VGKCDKGNEFTGSIKNGNFMTFSGRATALLWPRPLHCPGL